MQCIDIILAILALLNLTLGQVDYGQGPGDPHRGSRGLMQKNDRITLTSGFLPESTEVPEVVVYVDQYGRTVEIATETVVYLPEVTSALQSSITAASVDTAQPYVSGIGPSVFTATSSDNAQTSIVGFVPPAVGPLSVASDTAQPPISGVAPPLVGPNSIASPMVTETTLKSSSITPAAASTAQISVTGFISQAVTSAPIAMTTVTETAAAAPSVEQVTTSSAPVISSTSTTSDTTTSTTTVPSPISTSTSAPSNAPPMLMGRYGITYSPYKANHQCKSADEVAADFALFASQYGAIRIYGTDCNQVYTVAQAAKAYGNQLFLGIYDVTNVETEVSLMATGLNNDWTMVNTISVGNEYVNNGGDPDTAIAALNQARAALQTAGYAGPMVIVDTFSQVLKFPRLCDESDYCTVNCHAFFDKTSNSSHAGAYLDSVVTQLRSVISDPHTRVVITETGWPWKGDDNGLAVPGLAEQAEAISLIKDLYSETPYDVFLFTAFNDMWKPSEVNTFHAEQFWGLGGVYSPSDKGLITE